MINAIVLAAGNSRRMGRNKLLLNYKGRPLLAHVVDRILAAKLGRVLVVTGFEAEKLRGVFEGMDLQFVHNPDYEKGMTSSIQAGVAAADGEGFMICLSDMPYISADEYKKLGHAFHKQHLHDNACIIQPSYDSQIGNPVTFSAAWRREILSNTEAEGCKNIIRRHQENVYRVEMSTPGVLLDIDAKDDYDRLLEGI
jgi:molybdenum cofactor cytidylyltransferase